MKGERDLKRLADEAMARFNALSPEEQKAHRQAQRESWVRGMTTPCEHGVLDFEQCGECRAMTRTEERGDGLLP
jgi:hypothetical protein